MEECKEFIKEHKELRNNSVMERQNKKYLKLWDQKYKSGNSGNGTCIGGCSNQDKNSNINTKHWFVNLSSQPLSPVQETVLAHGPNFTVLPRPPFQEYITAVEVACQSLKHQRQINSELTLLEC